MSASKKKLQRREAVDTTQLTEEQIKQAEYKKKARLYTIIGIVVVVLVAALLIWNSGLFQKNATAATIGEEKLSVTELSYYYYTNQYYQMYTRYGISEDTIYNEEKGTTFGDFYLEQALSSAQLVTAVYHEALANGHSAADVQAEVDADIANMKAAASANNYSYKSYLKAVLGRYMTPAVYKELLTRSLVASHYATEVQDKAYDSFTSADLEAYYSENADLVDTFTYSYLYFKADTVETKGEDGKELPEDEVTKLKEAAMAAAKTKAEAALNSYNNDGVTIADLIKAGEPSTSADHTTAVGTNAISAVFNKQLLELDVDEATVVESKDNGYYVVVFHGRERNNTLAANIRHILAKAENFTDSTGAAIAPTVAALEAAKTEADKILAEFKSGAQTSEAFAALANKYSDDLGSNTTGGLYENVTKGFFVSELDSWIFGDEAPVLGEPVVIRHDGVAGSTNAYWGYHVIYVESWGDPTWELNVRSTLTSEAVTEWQDALCDANPAKLASSAKHVNG